MIELTELRGVGIGTGVVVGPVLHVARQAAAAPTDAPSELGAEAELARAREALAAVSAQLRERAAGADAATADVLEAQALMTDDPALLDGVQTRLATGVTAEKAVADAFAEFAALELPGLRESVNMRPEAILLPKYEWAVVPTLTDPCKGKRRCR